jgi:hypothetical protein
MDNTTDTTTFPIKQTWFDDVLDVLKTMGMMTGALLVIYALVCLVIHLCSRYLDYRVASPETSKTLREEKDSDEKEDTNLSKIDMSPHQKQYLI